MEYKQAVYIGRFQPFHLGHLRVVAQGLRIAEKVTVVVGSAKAAPTIRNPFSFEQREAMIKASLREDERRRVRVVGVRDYFYAEDSWLSDVQAKTDAVFEESDAVALLGSYKDGSSYYLNSFPQWDFVPAQPRRYDCSGTSIRQTLFERHMPSRRDWEGRVPGAKDASFEHLVTSALGDVLGKVPSGVGAMLVDWMKTPQFADMVEEYEFLLDYKESWQDSPFPPQFVTVDAIVICAGHVLVVKRKFSPGKNLWALPGGFVKPTETLQAACLRELKEETGIRIDKRALDEAIVAQHTFDHPERSLRGRTITQGFLIRLRDGKLPEVKGGDDAAKAKWMPLWDVMAEEDRFFEDHAHVINYFTHNAVGA